LHRMLGGAVQPMGQPRSAGAPGVPGSGATMEGGEYAPANVDDRAPGAGPRVINVGIGGGRRVAFRRAWREHILPSLERFNPDLILISSGFDAHHKDVVNGGYVGVCEDDFSWLTRALVQVANSCCAGRVVSVLEGGYRVQGGVVSAFARSVAAHVRALAEPSRSLWDLETARQESALREELQAGTAEVQMEAEVEAEVEAEAAQKDPLKRPVKEPELTPKGEEDNGGGKRRRRGVAVDYTALNAKLEEEIQEKAAHDKSKETDGTS
ncbi:hypothetical protein CYMTET_22822, partial [Cymbomonas tetramitiformis]